MLFSRSIGRLLLGSALAAGVIAACGGSDSSSSGVKRTPLAVGFIAKCTDGLGDTSASPDTKLEQEGTGNPMGIKEITDIKTATLSMVEDGQLSIEIQNVSDKNIPDEAIATGNPKSFGGSERQLTSVVLTSASGNPDQVYTVVLALDAAGFTASVFDGKEKKTVVKGGKYLKGNYKVAVPMSLLDGIDGALTWNAVSFASLSRTEAIVTSFDSCEPVKK